MNDSAHCAGPKTCRLPNAAIIELREEARDTHVCPYAPPKSGVYLWRRAIFSTLPTRLGFGRWNR